MAETMADKVQELIAKGYKPCPNCGAYYNPAESNVKEWLCQNCGVDLSLSPEEVSKARLSDAELSVLLRAQTQKATLMKVLAICCVIGIFVLWIVHPLLGASAFIPAAVFAILSAQANSKAKTLLANNITRDILSEVFEECIYSAKHCLPEELLRKSALIANWDVASGSDLVSAKYKGHTIHFSDITLSEEVESTEDNGDTSTRYITKFQGQWMVIELDRMLTAQLRLREKLERKGKLSKKILGERYNDKSDIETENFEFNKRFQILTKDPHSAFYILTPHFMEYILAADDTADTRIYLSFVENQVHIACYTDKDFFEFQKHDAANLHQVRVRMKSELSYIIGIADELLKNEYLFQSAGKEKYDE